MGMLWLIELAQGTLGQWNGQLKKSNPICETAKLIALFCYFSVFHKILYIIPESSQNATKIRPKFSNSFTATLSYSHIYFALWECFDAAEQFNSFVVTGGRLGSITKYNSPLTPCPGSDFRFRMQFIMSVRVYDRILPFYSLINPNRCVFVNTLESGSTMWDVVKEPPLVTHPMWDKSPPGATLGQFVRPARFTNRNRFASEEVGCLEFKIVPYVFGGVARSPVVLPVICKPVIARVNPAGIGAPATLSAICPVSIR